MTKVFVAECYENHCDCGNPSDTVVRVFSTYEGAAEFLKNEGYYELTPISWDSDFGVAYIDEYDI